MAMTKKDFELIASAINNALKNNGNVIDSLADALYTTNPAFRRDKFVEACLKGWIPPNIGSSVADA